MRDMTVMIFSDIAVTLLLPVFLDLTGGADDNGIQFSDIRFQLAKIACITRGFHIMDEEIYERCHGRFAVADSIYRVLLKAAKEKAEKPELSATLDEYRDARQYYIALQTEYMAVKTAKKAVKVILKKLTKPLISPILPF